MNTIQINRLDTFTEDNYTTFFNYLCGQKNKHLIVLKDYINHIKLKNWTDFFCGFIDGNHEITIHDVGNIKLFYDKMQLLKSIDNITILSNYGSNNEIKLIQKIISKLYLGNGFILLDSWGYINKSTYFFVDLCWCAERGIRIFNHNFPVELNCRETEL